jgi:predicted acyl esterase
MTTIRREVTIEMSDGIALAALVYLPEGDGPFPTLIAASPYRYDNDDIPPSMVFFWLETGPIEFYVGQGYAYVHVDVRGTGKSEGSYGFLDRRERRDLYEAIEWVAQRDWSTGKIGSIGMSYYCMAQWMMISERPPHLTCAAPYDGHYDPYRGWAYPGGVMTTFMWSWWNGSVRVANKYPANGSRPRDLDVDLDALLFAHPDHDDFWAERDFEACFADVDIPVYSIGNWAKRELHLGGNLRGFQLLGGPKKLRLLDMASGAEALQVFSTEEFHRDTLLPFYDHYLKGLDTDYLARPTVEYTLAGSKETRSAHAWPPEEVEQIPLYFDGAKSGTVTSVNDGTLIARPDATAVASYEYPQTDWVTGPVVMTSQGPDTISQTVTYTSGALTEGVDVVGQVEVVSYVSSTREDTSVVVRLSEQLPQDGADRAAGRQPDSHIVSKGWLRAAHRDVDEKSSDVGEPRYAHSFPVALTPGEPTKLRIALIGCGHHFSAGSRIRVEISCMDSKFTDAQFSHAFLANMVGTDAIYSGAEYPSCVLLPVRDRVDLPIAN